MTRQANPHPGGYSKKVMREGICSCCRTNPIAKGNFFLCTWCHTDPYNFDDRVDPDKVTEEDAEHVTKVVEEFEKTPPTPVKHFSCDCHTQEELQAILDIGVR